jgi:hypothetical protein
MKLIKSALLSAAVAFAAYTAPASALPVTIDFGGANAVAPSLAFSGGGYTVTATPWVTNSAKTVFNAGFAVTQTKAKPAAINEGGLGVFATKTSSQHDINAGSLNANDALQLTFNQKVKLQSVRFSRVDGSDIFDFYLDGFANYMFSAATPMPLAQYIFNLKGTTFAFGATRPDSDYKIRSVTVSAVPLPPAVMLFLTGLFGIGVLARRRVKIG